jgi:hypothetical protein
MIIRARVRGISGFSLIKGIIPQVMKLAMLADVRALMQHLPDGHRQRSTWRHVASS